MGFLGSSGGKEFTWNARDPGLIPGLGRFPWEGIGYPRQYSWASLVAQRVKTLPALRETWVRSLGWEDLLEKGMATHTSIHAWRISMDRGAWRATVHEVTESDMTKHVWSRFCQSTYKNAWSVTCKEIWSRLFKVTWHGMVLPSQRFNYRENKRPTMESTKA